MSVMETEFTPSSYVVPGRPVIGSGFGGGNAELPQLEVAEVTSVYKLMEYLAAADATYYTPERLRSMSKNDMRYAHRMLEGIDGVTG